MFYNVVHKNRHIIFLDHFFYNFSTNGNRNAYSTKQVQPVSVTLTMFPGYLVKLKQPSASCSVPTNELFLTFAKSHSVLFFLFFSSIYMVTDFYLNFIFRINI